MYTETSLPKFTNIVFLFIMFATLRAWPFLYINVHTINFILSVAFTLALIYDKIPLINSNAKRVSTFIIIVATLLGTYGNLNAYIGAILNIYPFILFLNISAELQIKLFLSFKKYFSYIISLSVLFWILFLIGIPFPHFRQQFTDFYIYDNYFFFVDNASALSISIFPRFYSIFLEPGYLSCLMVLLLFLDKFDLHKKQNIIFVIAIFLTFSIAGILLLIIGWFAYTMKSNPKIKRISIVLSLILFGAFEYISTLDNSNVLKIMIVNRLTFNNEKGTIQGYNRAGRSFERWWENNYPHNAPVLFGMKEKFDGIINQESAVDMRAYLVKYGLLATLAYFIFMLYLYRINKSYYGGWYFLLYALIAFRGYTIMYWLGFLIFYTVGLEILQRHKEIESKCITE